MENWKKEKNLLYLNFDAYSLSGTTKHVATVYFILLQINVIFHNRSPVIMILAYCDFQFLPYVLNSSNLSKTIVAATD